MNSISDCTQEAARCLHCGKPRCVAACPVGNSIPQFLSLAASGRQEDAVRLVGHPFGEICGYVCPHELQCQGSCVLSSRGAAVRTGFVERTIFAAHPYELKRIGVAAAGVRVAVVGGGVSGLTYAAKMYEQGAEVTVFEHKQLLDTLRLIPDFRLPRQALERVERQLDGKLRVVCRHVDAELLAELGHNFDAVYLATGATETYSAGMLGDELCTPYTAFLHACGEVAGKHVVVLGGGNTAMDCARMAARCGAEATVAYRRQRADMPAFAKEVECAQAEHVGFLFNVAPIRLQQDSGQLLLTLAKTVSEGRGKLTITDIVQDVHCDFVVSALGASPCSEMVHAAQECGILVGGDAAGGKTVAQAVADGLGAARKTIDSIGKR